MDNQKFVIFGEWIKEPTMHETNDEISLKELKEIFRGYSQLENVQEEEMHIFIEDEDGEIDEVLFKEITKKHGRHRFHCHRCRKIDVQVSFNGREFHREFNPATTEKKIMHWLKEETGMSKEEMMNHELRIGNLNGEVMRDDLHLGSYITFPQCHIQLFLTPKERFQG